MHTRVSPRPRPLSSSLSRFSSVIAVCAAITTATGSKSEGATVIWDGGGSDLLWTTGLNWDSNTAPAPTDDLVFGTGTVGVIRLVNHQSANALSFNQNFTLGNYGTNLVLTNTSGNISVATGVFATMNASYGGTNGINLSGGGSLFLNHPLPTFGGNITVDGAGTTLVHRAEGVAPQYSGPGGTQTFGRFDSLSLGFTTSTRTISLTNGGEYKILAGGNNNEGNGKNVVFGSGGGAYNLPAGFQHWNMDDVGQISNAVGNTMIKRGAGRLTLTGALADANPLAGNIVIEGGLLDLSRLQGGATVANTRFAGITGTTSTTVGTNSVTVNDGGFLVLNNGTVGNLDVASLILNDGSYIGTQGNGHEIGIRTQGGATPGSTMQINGTVTIMHRDAFNTLQGRNFFINSDLTGSGVLNILPATQNSSQRVVIQRATAASTFNGTFRLNENANLEANPRFNDVANIGKVLAGGDIEFAGWGSTLDVRDFTTTASVLDYTDNEISVTTTQAGGINFIQPTGATASGNTGKLFNFGSLTMGDHRIALSVRTANPFTSGSQVGFADTAVIKGNAVIEMQSTTTAGSFSTLVLSNTNALSEDAAGRSLTLIKTGVGTAAAADVISGGAISISNLEVSTGTLRLRGANGAIVAGFGGAAPVITINGGANNFTNGLPTQGLLHLDGSAGHVVGTTTVISADNNNNRVVDSATLNLRSNSTLRLSSANNIGTTETIGTTNVSGHGTFDLVKTGTAVSPVALTLSTLNLTGTRPTVNFTGSALGLAGANTTRIIIPGTSSGFLPAQYHSGNEWAKYDSTVDSGFALGVTPFSASDYTIDTAENTWAPGQQIKQTGLTLPTLTANRTADRFNFQTTATNQALDLNGFVLTAGQGGIISSANTIGIVDGATGFTPSGTAGLTAGTTNAPSQLYVHANAQIDIRTPIRDNAAGGVVDFVKSGTATVRLIHQNLDVGTGGLGAAPFTATPWESTLSGSWIINDGKLEVHRGEFLGGRPVVLNGGHLEINQPVSNANADGIIPGWGNNIVINGNATVAADDNGESSDPNTGDRALVRLGSLTINNGSTLGISAFSDQDFAFMGGATFNGHATINTGIGRGGGNQSNIINGVLAGSGFDMVGYNGAAVLELGGTQTDSTNNTYAGPVTVYAGILRLNKANGFTALTDSAANEDLIINGGSLFWGPGQHGDLLTTNSINSTNNGLVGIAPTSPAAIKNAGMNQIADTAAITLLSGTLGESDRITNEKFGRLVMKNGTVNVGLGTLEIDTMTVSGGALGFDRGGTLKVGALTMLPGAFQLNIFTGLPTPDGQTTVEIGTGGLSLSGQNILMGSGYYGNNVAGSGGLLKLGGNVTVTGSTELANSFNTGIYVQTGLSFRELGGTRIDLMGGNREFNIASDVQYYITPRITNGGIVKSGGGGLVLESYEPNLFTGAVVVNAGVLNARSDGAFGTSAGGVTINAGGTVKLDSGWTYGDSFTVSGAGALVPGDANVREIGALVSESGTNRLSGGFSIAGDATVASNAVLDPSAVPSSNGAMYRPSNLIIDGAAGVTGTGTLKLSGHGNGVISNGVNTTGGLVKDGAGRWVLNGAGTFAGPTSILAGQLLITNAAALGTAAGGTTVFGGSLELGGGLTLAEPLTLFGAGSSSQSGAVVSFGAGNTISSAITLGADTTLRSNAGNLAVGTVSAAAGVAPALTLSGPATGSIGAITTGINGGLTKEGTGIWRLTGANTFGGATTVNGGELVLDFAANNGAKLSATSPLNIGGAKLTVLGNASAASSQTVAGLNLLGGESVFSVVPGAGQTAALNVGAITRSGNATVRFNIPAGGSVGTSASNVNGILGSYATVGGNDWAAVSGGLVVPFSGYTSLDPAGGGTGVENARITTAQKQLFAAAANSLKIENNAGLALGASSLTLTSGGLLHTGNRNSGISGTGIVSGVSAADDLIINTADGVLGISAPLIGAGTGGLTKAGAGELRLFGTSEFTGGININAGLLTVPGGVPHPGALGGSLVNANRLITINGGAFQALGDYDLNDYDASTAGVQSVQFVIGAGGATLRSQYGSLIINDAGQLQGPGDLTFTGGGRYTLNGGGTVFAGFGGNVTVNGGILIAANSGSLGGRQEQVLTLKPGSAVINQTGFGLGANGLPNDIVSNGGVEFYAAGTNRVYGGDIRLAGRNLIALTERDNLTQERQVYFNGRVSGTDVTLDVFGVNNGNPFYLASGSNDLTGEINLNASAVLEARMPGSLGVNSGDVTINLAGANSRLLLRNFQNGDFRSDVVASDNSEINVDRLVGFAGGNSQLLSINDLTLNGTNKILSLGGGNGYTLRVAGAATFNANTIINAGANILFDNPVTFASGANTLDKRGGGSIILRANSNHTGPTIVQQGFLILQGANGTLANSSSIEVRGGELRIDNSDAINTNRLNDAGALILGGGTFRLTGIETLPPVTATSGTTIIVNNPISDTVPNPLTLTGFKREVGAVLQFQLPDAGQAVGSGTFGQARVSSRILIPGLADTTQTIPGMLGNNNFDFIQYDGTTLDNGVALGVRDMRNPGAGSIFPTNYTNDPGEGAWTDAVIARLTVGADNTTTVTTLTADRALDAIKIEPTGTGRTRNIDVGANTLRIEGGGIIAVAATTSAANILGAGSLTAGTAVPGTSTAELFFGGNLAITVAPKIVDNGTQKVAVVKTGPSQVSINGANTFTGGLFVNTGTVNTTNNQGFGPASNPIHLSGGTLLFNVSNAGTNVDLGGFGQNVTVNANSNIVMDNGATNTADNNLAFGSLTIGGPYTLGIRGFDSVDIKFTGTHSFAGTPVIDLPQAGSGSNPNTAAAASVVTLEGAITGSGFFVSSSGNTNDTAARLQIGAGESVANTYAGKVTLLPGSNNDDLFVELNKAAGTTAITGDLQLDGGTVLLLADDQIADSSNLQINRGVINFAGKNETIASVKLAGGGFITNPGTGVQPFNTVNITGGVEVTGLTSFAGVNTGFTIGNNSTVTIGGLLKIGTLGRVHLTEGQTGAVLNVNGGLEMTGALLSQSNGAGANIVRLNSDVTTFPSASTSNLGNSGDSDTFLELVGTRKFEVADGGAGIDLSLSTVIRNSTDPAGPGTLVKNGDGVVQIQGGGSPNTYSGGTLINAGSVILWKSTGVNAIPSGTLTIGDGTGGAKADRVIARNSEQIANNADVVIANSGLLDLATFNTSETIGTLAGAGAVEVGPSSTLTVGGDTNSVFSGSIQGGGSFFKAGLGTLELSGASELAGGTTVNGGGTLVVSGSLGGGATVDAGSTLAGTGTVVGPVSALLGGLLSPGNNGAGSFALGSLDLQTGSAFKLEIGGTTLGTGYDSANITGGITLAGDLQGSLINGFTPAFGDRFFILLNDGTDPVVGNFNGLAEGAQFTIGTTPFQITYQANFATGQLTGGNDVALVVPEPGSAAALLAGVSLLGMRRFRRRR